MMNPFPGLHSTSFRSYLGFQKRTPLTFIAFGRKPAELISEDISFYPLWASCQHKDKATEIIKNITGTLQEAVHRSFR